MLKNELYWIELKDNWKERKKTFFRKQEIVKDET